MRNGKDKNSCLFGEELVSYIYGELPSSGRSAFEEHLLNCGDCTNEFAVVSMSRLGVYEWHRDDFMPLETPVFAIPYERPIAVSEFQVRWHDALRGLFSPARLATAGGAFAILAIAFGAFYVSTSNTVELTTRDISIPNSVEQIPSPPKFETAKISAPLTEQAVERDIRVNYKPTNRPSKPVQAKVTKATSKPPVVTQASIPAKAPRLGAFEDAEDRSLRLADLVADIDSDDF